MKPKLHLLSLLFIFSALTSPAQTPSVKQQIINKLIEMGELTSEAPSDSVSIRSVDLNRDGRPEFIVSCTCSLGVMTTFVFRKTANGVEDIFYGGVATEITPLNSYTNGWRNLRLRSYSTGLGFTEIHKFNGTKYQ